MFLEQWVSGSMEDAIHVTTQRQEWETWKKEGSGHKCTSTESSDSFPPGRSPAPGLVRLWSLPCLLPLSSPLVLNIRAPDRAFFIKHSVPQAFSGPQPHVESPLLPKMLRCPWSASPPFKVLHLPPPAPAPLSCLHTSTASSPRSHAEAVEEELPERLLWARCSPRHGCSLPPRLVLVPLVKCHVLCLPLGALGFLPQVPVLHVCLQTCPPHSLLDPFQMLQLLPVHLVKDHPITLGPPGSVIVFPAFVCSAPSPWLHHRPLPSYPASHLKLPLSASAKCTRPCWLVSSGLWTHSPSVKRPLASALSLCSSGHPSVGFQGSSVPSSPPPLMLPFPGVVCSSAPSSVYPFPRSRLPCKGPGLEWTFSPKLCMLPGQWYGIVHHWLTLADPKLRFFLRIVFCLVYPVDARLSPQTLGRTLDSALSFPSTPSSSHLSLSFESCFYLFLLCWISVAARGFVSSCGKRGATL